MSAREVARARASGTPGPALGARPLVLASASPRRRDLLAALGLSFEVAVGDVDERPHAKESACVLTWDRAPLVDAALTAVWMQAYTDEEIAAVVAEQETRGSRAMNT